MSFLKHVLSLLLVSLSLVSRSVLVAATAVQKETIGIASPGVVYSTGWSTVSNAAGSFMQTSGKANEVEIFLPAGTVSLSYVGFKQTGGALYAVCLDCGSSGKRLLLLNASDPNADSSTPVVLFSFAGLDPTTAHNLQVVNSADPAFGDTSVLTFKELDITVDTTASTSSSTSATTSTTTTSSSTSLSTSKTTSSSSAVSTSTSTLSQSTSLSTTSISTLTSLSTTLAPTTTRTTSSSSASSSTTSPAGSLSRSGLSTGTIVAAAVSSAGAVLLLLGFAICLLYRARNRQLRSDFESNSLASGLTRQISAPSVVAVPFEEAPAAAVSAYTPPRSATSGRPNSWGNFRRRSYRTGAALASAMGAAQQRDGVMSSMSSESVPLRPRNPYEGVIQPDVPIDYPSHVPRTPGTPGTSRQRGMFR